jgi:hypothetical protein
VHSTITLLDFSSSSTVPAQYIGLLPLSKTSNGRLSRPYVVTQTNTNFTYTYNAAYIAGAGFAAPTSLPLDAGSQSSLPFHTDPNGFSINILGFVLTLVLIWPLLVIWWLAFRDPHSFRKSIPCKQTYSLFALTCALQQSSLGLVF